MDMLFLTKILPTRSLAKVVSESLSVIKMASKSRLRPSKANIVLYSPAMRDGCTELRAEILNIVKKSLTTCKRSDKLYLKE
jgi:hypothetical protein